MIAYFTERHEAEETLMALRDASQEEYQLHEDDGTWIIIRIDGQSYHPMRTEEIEEVLNEDH